MRFNPDIHHRRSIRLQDYDYSQEGYYFVTRCTKDRIEYFGEIKNGEMELSKIEEIVQKCWYEIPEHFNNVTLDEFIIMSNHVHGIIVIENDCGYVGAYRRHAPTTTNKYLKPNSLGSIIIQFKSIATKRIWLIGYCDFAWQRNYYEHIIRNEKELNQKRRYIIDNPLQWELDRNNPENILSKSNLVLIFSWILFMCCSLAGENFFSCS